VALEEVSGVAEEDSEAVVVAANSTVTPALLGILVRATRKEIGRL